MFTQLIDGLRHIRNPLAVGYSILAAAWLLAADRIPTEAAAVDSGNDAVARIGRLSEAMGTVATFGLVTVVAITLGGIVLQALPAPAPLTERAKRGFFPLNFFRPGSIDPAGGVVGVAQARLLAGVGMNELEVPSLKREAERLVADVERLEEEIELRVVWALASLAPICTAVVAGGLWFTLGLVVPLLLLWDAGARGRSVGDELTTLIHRNRAAAEVLDFAASDAASEVQSRAHAGSQFEIWIDLAWFINRALVHPEPESLPVAAIRSAIEEYLASEERGAGGSDSVVAELFNAWVGAKQALGEPTEGLEELVPYVDSDGRHLFLPTSDPRLTETDDSDDSAGPGTRD